MGTSVLRGISASLLVTLLTLLAGMLWAGLGFGGVNTSTLVDIGLIVSSISGGYRAGKDGGVFILGGMASLGYVIIGIFVLALYYPITYWGALQVIGEGVILGLIAGGIGASQYSRRPYSHRPSYSNWRTSYMPGGYQPNYSQSIDAHLNDWDNDLFEENKSNTLTHEPVQQTDLIDSTLEDKVYPVLPAKKRSNARWWEEEF